MECDWLKIKIQWISSYLKNAKLSSAHSKDNGKAKKQRDVGNAHFKKKEYHEAIKLYSKGLQCAAWGPSARESELNEVALNLANRSAALFHVKCYKECIEDIDSCIEHGYLKGLVCKVLVRKARCELCLAQNTHAEETLAAAKGTLQDVEPAKRGNVEKDIESIEKELQKRRSHVTSGTEEVKQPQITDAHEIMVQASTDLDLCYNKSQGRHVLARQPIRAGHVLMVEKPFAAVLLPDHYDDHCNRCFDRLTDNIFYPCRQCVNVRYCSRRCEENAWLSYHRIECAFQDLLHAIGIAHLSLRVILTAGLENLLSIRKYVHPSSDTCYIKSDMSLSKRKVEPSNHSCESSDSLSLFQSGSNSNERELNSLCPNTDTSNNMTCNSISQHNITQHCIAESSSSNSDAKTTDSNTPFADLISCNTGVSKDSVKPAENSANSVKAKDACTIPGVSANGKYACTYRAVYALMPHMQDMHLEDLAQYALTASLLLHVLNQTDFFDIKENTNSCENSSRPESNTPSKGIEKLHINETQNASKKTHETCDDKNERLSKIQEETGFAVTEQDLAEISSISLEEKRLYIGELLMRHICQLVCNAHAITRVDRSQSAGAGIVDEESQERVATAIYPTASLMNHACEPTITSSFYKDTLVVKAVKDTEAGQEIFNCYGPHHKRMRYAERQESLQTQYFFTCRCTACEGEQSNQAIHQALCCPKCKGAVLQSADAPSKGHCVQCDHVTTITDEVLKQLQKAVSLFNKAMSNEQNITESCKLLQKALKIRQHYLYEYNNKLGETYNALAKLYAEQENFKSAAEYLEKSCDVTRHIYDANSLEYAHELHTLAEVYLHAGEYARSSHTAQEAIRVFVMHYGNSHSRVQELRQLLEVLQTV